MIIVNNGEKRPFVPELIHKANTTYVMNLESKEITDRYAELDFNRQKDKMIKNGQEIGDIMIEFKTQRDVVCGNQTNKETIFIQHVYCERDTDEWSKEKK